MKYINFLLDNVYAIGALALAGCTYFFVPFGISYVMNLLFAVFMYAMHVHTSLSEKLRMHVHKSLEGDLRKLRDEISALESMLDQKDLGNRKALGKLEKYVGYPSE